MSSEQAAAKILSLFEQPDFVPPMFEFHEASRRYNCKFGFDDIVKVFAWSKSALPELQELCF